MNTRAWRTITLAITLGGSGLSAGALATALPLLMSTPSALAEDFVAPLRSPDLNPAPDGPYVDRTSADVSISLHEVQIHETWMSSRPGPTKVRFILRLPDIDASLGRCVLATDPCPPLAHREDENSLGVTGRVDGRPITFTTTSAATFNGRDISRELAAQKIPLVPYSHRTVDALATLPTAILARWLQDGWIRRADTLAVYFPQWTISTALSFEADLLPEVVVATDIRYTPPAGHGTGVEFLGDDEAGQHTLADHRQRYCMDKAFVDGVRALARARTAGDPAKLEETQVDFDLMSPLQAKNLAGDYRVTVDKGSKDTLISLCGKNIRKTGPTTFQGQPYADEPRQDFEILLISAPPLTAPSAGR